MTDEIDSIGEGFDGSSVVKTTDDGKKSSITPQEPLPEGATETEKQLVEDEDKT